MKLKTFVFGMLLAILFSMPWAFIADRFHFGTFVTGVVAFLIGSLWNVDFYQNRRKTAWGAAGWASRGSKVG